MHDNPTNFLSSGIQIKGSIRFENDMHIEGKIEGEITSTSGRVTIGESATITGDITAGDVRIYGKVDGKITSKRCELKQQARVKGDMKTISLSMEEGAQLHGNTEIG
ncbi:MAG: polymer-forming cytoskeletal protein [Akkermansia sp.]|nr:polymer-forming cytoskeletal protein [Akkermansia sp.]